MTKNSHSTKQVHPFYFAAWRWHFYSGIFVIPFLLMLAITGVLMLWFTTIAPEYGDLIAVKPTTEAMTITAQSQAALTSYPEGETVKYVAPYDAQTPALFHIISNDLTNVIALDPYSGTILRESIAGNTWDELFDNMHGTLLIGDFGDRLIEIAASLGIILLITGIYIGWPRNGKKWSDVLILKFSAKGRAFWKSLHQVLGFWTSIILLFFLISGLSWAGIWGGKFVQAWSTFPDGKWGNVPVSTLTHDSLNAGAQKEIPWALEQTLMPASGSDEGVEGLPEDVPVVLESVVALGRAIGLEGRFQVNSPKGETGVWTLSQDSMSADSTNSMSDRTVHIDQYTGKILATIEYKDYSLAGKSMATGIALHEGFLGWWNIALNFLFCLSIVFICFSGMIMWWKRRPKGALRLVAPPMPENMPLWKSAVLIAIITSMAFPMAGFALIVMLAIDVLIISNIAGLKRTLS